MCGIAGLIHYDVVDSSCIRSMADTIRHRGPDDEGFVVLPAAEAPVPCWGMDTPEAVLASDFTFTPQCSVGEMTGLQAGVLLGHRRLSIIDITPAGHQPMSSDDARHWIVFNGEIYNHIELREELESSGYIFATHSDTEVILAAYRMWGKDCLQHLNGMFSFLLYDVDGGRLFGARDRFGIKPFYYHISASGIAFASEIKQFTVLPGWKAVMNGQRVYDYLNWGVSDHTDETMFEGVFQLRGGEAVELDVHALLQGSGRPPAGGRLPVSRWYTLESSPFDGDEAAAAEQFREYFFRTVRMHIRADVPVGSCLSGGLDSSSIVCVMNDILREQGAHANQKTFSACSDVKRFDERVWIEAVVNDTGVEAHYVFPSLDDLFETYSGIVWHQDEPFGSTSIFAQWQVFRQAAESGVKVMLDGQGADELLAGYHGFFGARFAGLFKQGRWLTLWREIQLTKKFHGMSEWQALQRIADMLLPESVRQLARGVAGVAAADPGWIDMQQLGAEPRDPFAATGRKAGSVRNISESMLVASNLQMLLHWEDRDSMAHSIEARVPFLDHRLIEFTLGMPDHFKLSAGVTKRVLREGMRGVLPEAIRTRMDKLGFVTPEEVWFRDSQPEQFRERLLNAIERSRGILKPEAIDVFDQMVTGQRPYNAVVWRLICFGEWVRQYHVVI
ncbi:asparagine synthase (glutamine-hydrolyzing) [Mariprofundus erugo]|uniref:asparagine synthase (glutamine-hydrolyzing) n=1 Tax=Mariprofundus erugo TaxID=2528639 RepID=A0A5R9GVV7_9PROT|nr:asparagine synthase (glutamine-hydrolyzing) [Mariprofundus erugo]TLS69045.1 asparagine synthase (glutamine-hydrolyzing) [Mariprofundus erugo]